MDEWEYSHSRNWFPDDEKNHDFFFSYFRELRAVYKFIRHPKYHLRSSDITPNVNISFENCNALCSLLAIIPQCCSTL